MKLMFKRLLRDQRAITPVLSSLLLTVIAVAAMAIATSATYMITANLKDNMSERATVEDVWFDGSTIIFIILVIALFLVSLVNYIFFDVYSRGIDGEKSEQQKG